MSSAPPARTELAPLLADVKEQPTDDRLRLVLADWLEDTGLPLDAARAELIRAQLALPWLAPDGPERLEGEKRARRLVNEHGRAWLGPVVPWLGKWEAVRGRWAVTVWTGSLVRGRAMRALAGTEAWAWVEGLRLTAAVPGDLGALRDNPLLSALTGLDLGD